MFSLLFTGLSSLFILGGENYASASTIGKQVEKYTPDWESLDSRPLPGWYDDAKIGIFMHFGVYSVPGLGQGMWRGWNENNTKIIDFMEENYPPNFTYQDFGAELKMEFFDPNWIAELVRKSGAKYLVFTTKHHEGFVNWPSTYSYGWNSMDIGPKKDVIQELKTAFAEKAPDVHFGLYYSLIEWYNPLFLKDRYSSFETRDWVNNKMIPEMKEMVNLFEPELIFADGDNQDQHGYPNTTSEYWGSTDFLAWLYNESPVKENVIVNDRWGIDCRNLHGGYWTHHDKYNPGVVQEHKFENAMHVDKGGWGIRKDVRMSSIMSMDELISEIASTVSCNGNILVNVGPTAEGTIIPIFEERLTQMGGWLSINGEAIYETKPWVHQNDSLSKSPEVWYTQSRDGHNVYGIVLGWPMNEDSTITLGDVKTGADTKIFLLGYPTNQDGLSFTENETGVTIQFPPLQKFIRHCETYCRWGYTLSMTHLTNDNV